MKKKFGVIKLVMLCVVVGVVSMAPMLANVVINSNKLDPSKQESVSAYSGVVNVWNVDTFEGGSGSKALFLEHAATTFSKANKGVYFLVKNLTVEEFRSNLSAGVLPDIISFGAGLGTELKNYLSDLSARDFSNVRRELIESGMEAGGLKAVPILIGGMVLISTDEKLALAGKNAGDALLENINNCGFDTETKTKKFHTASVVVGENSFVNLESSIGNCLGGASISDVHKSPTAYDAYADFVAYNKGTILLGTHRDLYKISGRIAVGKVSGVKIEYLKGFTNLVQYAGVMNHLSGEKKSVSEEFLEFLVSEKSQKYSTQIGMVNTIGGSYYESGEFLELEKMLNEQVVVPKQFG